MIIERKVIQLGQSFVVALPKDVLKDVNKGDKIILSIKYIGKAEEFKEYECKVCNLNFVRDKDEDLYCPGCGNEDKEMIEESI